ncbi:hypothetical protein [Hymenobacter radiodurans]|uniref:hypothetical protein n=1 Tax=Hymenobacter radiodurans TaxID=2496028 RepID=UPI001058D00D|nr:hypothetical protein [Hymenobacter radiodurans]
MSEARVLEVKGDYLLLDNRAFGTGPDLTVCNVEMTFEANKQALHLDYSFYQEDFPAYDRTYEDQRLTQQGYRRKANGKSLILSLQGGRFVQAR